MSSAPLVYLNQKGSAPTQAPPFPASTPVQFSKRNPLGVPLYVVI